VEGKRVYGDSIVVENTYEFLLWLFPKVEIFPTSFRSVLATGL